MQKAARLGIRKETLDAEVAKLRSQFNDDAQAQSIIALRLTPIEPWPEPVNGAEVLHQVTDRFNLHVVLPLGAPHAIALFVAHIHAFEAFAHSPRLNLTSAFHQCGKTTTLDLIHVMVPRPLRTENLRAAVIFRVVDWASPTVLLDELDTYLPRAEELRGLLNAGHKRGACAYRCEGEGNAVRAFNAFAPAVLSGIGPLPATLHDRSIVILLEQAKPEQIQVRFDSRKVQVETILGQKLARWAKDNFPALQACDPKMPPGAYNRLADNWRPLFAIAQVAGGDWPRLALEAFTALTAKPNPQPSAISYQLSSINYQPPSPIGYQLSAIDYQLLSDIRQVFTKTGATRIASKQLVEALCGLADRPWLETCPGNKPITGSWLAHQLKYFGVNSRNVRLNGHQAKGYVLKDFAKAFATLAS